MFRSRSCIKGTLSAVQTSEFLIRLVHEVLEQAARRQPEKIALICEGRRWSYGRIDEMANRLANALRAQGMKRGDRVALHLSNSVEMVVGIFGTLKAGGVFVGISPETKEAKLQYIVQNLDPFALIARRDPRGWLAGIIAELPALRLVALTEESCPAANEFLRITWKGFSELGDESPAQPPSPVNVDLDLACLIYTSGTTGEPKGVMCDHSNVVFVTESIVEYLENEANDVILSVLPLAFSYGLYQLFATFRSQATLVLESSFVYPAVLLQHMQAERVTGFAGTPTVFAVLLQFDGASFDLSSLRYLTNAAAGLPVEHLRRLRDRFPKVAFYSMHGLTEVARTVYLPPELADKKPDSVGIPIPGVEAWIVNEQGERCGPGEVGELVVRGRNVMRGYWKDPKATAERFHPGVLPGERVCFTGDLFRTDQDGHFYFVARKDDLIKCRGEKVAPREVENVLHQIRGVAEAVVIGVPDPILGQAVKAFIVRSDPTLQEKQVRAFCRRQLEEHMIPKSIEFVTDLPKTASGKVTRKNLN